MRQVFIPRRDFRNDQVDMIRANVLSETADTVRVKLPGERQPKVFRKSDVKPARTVNSQEDRNRLVETRVHSANSFARLLY